MSGAKKEVDFDCLSSLQRAFSDYVQKNNGNASEIKEYHVAMDNITKVMKKSDAGYTYANEILDKCVVLIIGREIERALIEYKFMVDNLKKKYKI